MLAYEFYWRDEAGNSHLIGILPERRKDANRISEQSIMNWVEKIIGESFKTNDIFFFKIDMKEY